MTMRRRLCLAGALVLAAGLAPAPAFARGFSVEVWTDRGNDAVYQPGEVVQIKARATRDAYLLVYEIDAEGYVHVLYPDQGQRGFVEARHTYRVPDERADADLVVQGPVGEGYLVAIASLDPLEDLPWYL